MRHSLWDMAAAGLQGRGGDSAGDTEHGRGDTGAGLAVGQGAGHWGRGAGHGGREVTLEQGSPPCKDQGPEGGHRPNQLHLGSGPPTPPPRLAFKAPTTLSLLRLGLG